MAKSVGRGRPEKFRGEAATKKVVLAVVRKHGLSKGQEVLAKGVQVTPGQKKQVIEISLPTLGKLAKQAKIKLHRGRPKKAA